MYDCQGNEAAPCYQQRLMIGAIDTDKSRIQHAAAAAAASATNAAAEAEGERRFIECHTQGTQATVFLAQRLLVVRHRGGLCNVYQLSQGIYVQARHIYDVPTPWTSPVYLRELWREPWEFWGRC